MDREYILKGLACAGCAGKIEDEISRLDSVQAANVSVITSALKLTLRGGCPPDLTEAIKNIVHKHEPDVAVIDKATTSADHRQSHTHAHSHEPGSYKAKIIQLIAGALFLAAGVVAGVAADRYLDRYAYVSAILLIASYIVLGGEIVIRALKNIAKGRVFDENFLMSAATIGAFAIGEFTEAVTVMLF